MRIVFVVLAVGLAAIVGCGEARTTGGSGGKIQVTIGYADDLTGSNAVAGVAHQKAVQLAVEDVNSTSSKVQFKLVEKDTKSTQPDGVAAVQSLLADSSVDVFIGLAFSQTGQAVAPILKDDGRPALFLQVAALENRPPNVFSMSAPRAALAKLEIDKVIAPQGVKKVAYIWQDQPTLNGDMAAFREASKQNNIEIVLDQGATLQTTDFSSQVTNVVSANPDAVGIVALAPQSGTIASQLRSRGYKGLIFGQQAMASDAFRNVAGPAAENVYIFTFWDPAVANTDAKRFLDLYKKKYPDGSTPDVFTMQGWDAVHIMAQAVERAGTKDRSAILAQLREGNFSASAQSKISFGPDGFAQLSGYVIQITGNTSKQVAP